MGVGVGRSGAQRTMVAERHSVSAAWGLGRGELEARHQAHWVSTVTPLEGNCWGTLPPFFNMRGRGAWGHLPKVTQQVSGSARDPVLLAGGVPVAVSAVGAAVRSTAA